MKVLVAGSGAVASAAVTALLESGHEVRLLADDAASAARRWPHGVEPCLPAASMRRPEGAAEGCAAVLHLSAIREPWAQDAASRAGASTRSRIDIRATRGLVAEAERAGAERFVMLSSLRYERSDEDEGRTLRQAEGIARGFRGVWSILRAGLVYAPGEGALGALATMIRTLPAVPLVDRGRVEIQPLWYEDLGRALARAAEAPEAAGTVLQVAGPERATVGEVVDQICAAVGRKPAFIPVPGLLATLGAEATAILGLKLPARALALGELDGDSTLPASVPNALTSVLGVAPTMIADGVRALVSDAPEQTPRDAAGTIRRRRWWVDIEGSTRTARQLRDEFRRKASQVLQLEDGPPEGRMIKKGTLLSARVPLRGFVALRVAEVTPMAVTALTVDGDPLAGLVTIHFVDHDRALRAEVVVEAEATTPVDRVLDAAGGALEDLDWPAALERLVTVSGGRAPAGVQRDSATLDADDSRAVRDRAETLRLARQRSRAPAHPRAADRRPPARAARASRAARGPRAH